MKLIRRLKKKKSTESQHPTAAPIVDASTSSIANDKLTKTDAIQNAGKLFEVLQSVGDGSNLLSPLKALCGILKIATDMAVVGNLPFTSDNTDTNIFLAVSLQEW